MEYVTSGSATCAVPSQLRQNSSAAFLSCGSVTARLAPIATHTAGSRKEPNAPTLESGRLALDEGWAAWFLRGWGKGGGVLACGTGSGSHRVVGKATFRWTPHAPQRTVAAPSARRARGTATSRRERQRWQSTATVFELSSSPTSPRAGVEESSSTDASHRTRGASAPTGSLIFDLELNRELRPVSHGNGRTSRRGGARTVWSLCGPHRSERG